jgi:hypothetical protein
VPFTLAHPALVVPLRRWLSVGALGCGAMAPDAGYYLPGWLLTRLSWYPSAEVTHTLAAAIGFDAAVGLVLWVLWRVPVRLAVLGSLPDPWRTAALRESAVVLPGRRVPVRLLLLYVSSAVGAGLHVVLDVLTHERPQTPEVLVDETILGLPVASFLQWFLSVVGLVLLTWWGWRWLDGVAPIADVRPPARLVVVVGGALAAGLVGALANVRSDTAAAGGLTGAVVASLVGACAWGGAYLLAASAVSLSLPGGAAGLRADSRVSRAHRAG